MSTLGKSRHPGRVQGEGEPNQEQPAHFIPFARCVLQFGRGVEQLRPRTLVRLSYGRPSAARVNHGTKHKSRRAGGRKRHRARAALQARLPLIHRMWMLALSAVALVTPLPRAASRVLHHDPAPRRSYAVPHPRRCRPTLPSHTNPNPNPNQVPSNAAIPHIGATRVLSSCMVLWGIMSASTSLTP